MEFEDLLKVMAEKLGCGPLEADETGSVTLSVDDMPMIIMYLDEVQCVAVLGEIGEPPPEDHKERLYHALLVANHNFLGTGGATLSINAETGKVMMCRVLPLQTVDGESFFTQVEGFVNVLETWRKIVSDFSGAESAEISTGMQDSAPATSESEAEYAEVPANPLMGGPFMQV